MALAGALMLERLGPTGFDALRGHASDTVRGWACFMAGAMPGLDLEARLRLIRRWRTTRTSASGNGSGWRCAPDWRRNCGARWPC
ncbi:hypothetical protein WJ970_21385 [Achromobacter xylosoxidans]